MFKIERKKLTGKQFPHEFTDRYQGSHPYAYDKIEGLQEIEVPLVDQGIILKSIDQAFKNQQTLDLVSPEQITRWGSPKNDYLAFRDHIKRNRDQLGLKRDNSEKLYYAFAVSGDNAYWTLVTIGQKEAHSHTFKF